MLHSTIFSQTQIKATMLFIRQQTCRSKTMHKQLSRNVSMDRDPRQNISLCLPSTAGVINSLASECSK